MAATTMIWYRW